MREDCNGAREDLQAKNTKMKDSGSLDFYQWQNKQESTGVSRFTQIPNHATGRAMSKDLSQIAVYKPGFEVGFVLPSLKNSPFRLETSGGQQPQTISVRWKANGH